MGLLAAWIGFGYNDFLLKQSWKAREVSMWVQSFFFVFEQNEIKTFELHQRYLNDSWIAWLARLIIKQKRLWIEIHFTMNF